MKMKRLKKQETKINMKTLERQEAGKLLLLRVENQRCEAHQMSTGNSKRNGQANSYLFFMARPLRA